MCNRARETRQQEMALRKQNYLGHGQKLPFKDGISITGVIESVEDLLCIRSHTQLPRSPGWAFDERPSI